MSGPVVDIAIAGHFAFISSDTSGGTLNIFDISTPSSPTLVSSWQGFGGAAGLAYDGGVVYMAAHFEGVHAIDVSDPWTPTYLGSMDTVSEATSVDASLGKLYAGDVFVNFAMPGGLTVGPAHCVPPSVPLEAGCFPFELDMQAGVGGSVSPGSGDRAPHSLVAIAAAPDPHYVFREWVGQGNGSYSGFESTAAVTMHEPIQEVALFDRIGHEVTPKLQRHRSLRSHRSSDRGRKSLSLDRMQHRGRGHWLSRGRLGNHARSRVLTRSRSDQRGHAHGSQPGHDVLRDRTGSPGGVPRVPSRRRSPVFHRQRSRALGFRLGLQTPHGRVRLAR